MNRYHKALVTLSLVILLSVLNTMTARAGGFNPGAKVNSHISTKPAQSCNNWQDNGWLIEPGTYQIYSDYVSDFNHYFTQYPGTCKVAPMT
jgi:hypothetical protein